MNIMSKSEIFRSRLLGAALCPLMAVAFAAGGTTTVRAKGVSYDVLYTFTGGNDGANPSAGLIHDSAATSMARRQAAVRMDRAPSSSSHRTARRPCFTHSRAETMAEILFTAL
jgi:hypothetical protein